MQFHLPAKEAKNDSTLGPALGQYGVKGIDLCKRFNDQCISFNYKDGLILKVIVNIKKDRSFFFVIFTPPIFFLFEKISNNLFLNLRDIYKIALIKSLDLKFFSVRLIYKNLLHTLKRSKYFITL